MTAEEARELALVAGSGFYDIVMDAVKAVAANGHYSVSVDTSRFGHILVRRVIQKICADGFKVDLNTTTITVSWL